MPERAEQSGTRLGRFFARLARRCPFVATVLAGGMQPSGRQKVITMTQQSGVCCLAARMGPPDEPPFLCHLIRGHDGPHRNEKGEW